MKTEFKVSEHNGWKIFSLIGRLDTVTSPEAEKACGVVLQDNDKVAFDMSAMDYISSAGLRVLLRFAKQAKRLKKDFALFGACGMVDKVLEASGMNLLVCMYATLDDLP